MRKWIALFMMLFLPLQWSAALAAECCARHDAQTETTVMQHDAHHDHEHHAKADHQDGKQTKNDCQMDCAGCHAHHCAAVVIDADALAALPPLHSDDTPYLASITSPAPDNLYRPPLSRLA